MPASPFGDVLERARDSLGLLTAEARVDAEAVLGICREVEETEAGAPGSPLGVARSRELGRLVELLGRRSSKAIPYATLGRAALAHLRGAELDRDTLLAETSQKFALLGL